MGVFACILGIGNDFLSLLYRMVCGGLFFREVDNYMCRAYGSFGLGLFICGGRTKVHPYNMRQAYGFLKLGALENPLFSADALFILAGVDLLVRP
jgi:hypothetical protein